MVYKKYQYFVFEAARPGVVKAQLVANGAFTEFNLLKTRKASVSENIFIISLIMLRLVVLMVWESQ